MEEVIKKEFWGKLSKSFIFVLVFLLPLFFLPWTTNVLEFQKQTLLLFLVLAALISWLIHIFTSNKLDLNFSFFNIAVVILLFTTFLSWFFSISRYTSFWGLPVSLSASFLTLLTFVVLYFLIVNLFKKSEIIFLFFTLFLSGFLVALFFILQLFGVFILPFDFAKNSSFNTIGTTNGLAIYLALLLIILTPLLFGVKKVLRVILGIFGVIFFIPLLLINFQAAWFVLLLGSAILFSLGIREVKKTSQSAFIFLLSFFLVVGVFFAFFKLSLPGFPQVSSEITLTQQTSFHIFKQLPLKSIILGTGPGTFFYDWLKYKPPEINDTIFWALVFNLPASEILDRAIGNGILGVLALFFLLAVCLRKVLMFFVVKRGSEADFSELESKENEIYKYLLLGIFAGLAGLAVSLFWYPINISTSLLLWLLVSSVVLVFGLKRKSFDLKTSSVNSVAISFLAVLILVLGVSLAIYHAQYYLAELKYSQGLLAFNKGEIDSSLNNIAKAAEVNPKMDIYWKDLSQLYIFKLQEFLKKADLTKNEERQKAESLIISAVNSSNRATQVGPNNAINWSIRGFVYRNIIGIVGGAENFAVSSYQKAVELEPLNPYLYTEIGRTYLALADLLGNQNKNDEKVEIFKRAQESFEKALAIKSDYAPANFQIAMIYIREGKVKEAITKLEETKKIAPFDTGLAFQLGLVYYNNNQFNEAKAEFERAILIDPNYSNARYFLGLILERQGLKQEAILQFEKIAELNPDNEEVKKILANLKAGKRALEGIVPGEPPIEEKQEGKLKK
jgi:tetratricopeptide (TPR) repeat protein